MEAKVSIIILNWNGWKDTIECLESIYQINYLNYNVIIVDNNSEDDSLDKIQMYCEGKLKVNSKFIDYNPHNKPIDVYEYSQEELKTLKLNQEIFQFPSNKKLTIIKNDKNYGFAEGNNIGIKYVLDSTNSDYILLLNNDTVVDKNFLYEMVIVAKNDPKIGVCGSKTYYYDYDGQKTNENFEGGKINIFKGEAYYVKGNEKPTIEKPKTLDYIAGSCFLIKKDVVNDVGFLDKDYFLYWEEADWCFRIKMKGYKLMYIPRAKIYHKMNKDLNKIMIYYMARNRFLFMKKNSNNIQMTSFLLYFFLFKFWIKLFTYIFYHKKPKITFYYLKGIIDGLDYLFIKL